MSCQRRRTTTNITPMAITCYEGDFAPNIKSVEATRLLNSASCTWIVTQNVSTADQAKRVRRIEYIDAHRLCATIEVHCLVHWLVQRQRQPRQEKSASPGKRRGGNRGCSQSSSSVSVVHASRRRPPPPHRRRSLMSPTPTLRPLCCSRHTWRSSIFGRSGASRAR